MTVSTVSGPVTFPDTTIRNANEIVLQANPRGVFLEGTISGTGLRPGTLMEIKPAGTIVNNRNTYQAYQPGSDGTRQLLAILLPAQLLGQALEVSVSGTITAETATQETAFNDGDHCWMYVPAPGEEVAVRVSHSGTGTADEIAVGDKLIAVSGTGLFIKTTGSPQSQPFQAIEAVADVSASGTLVRCRCTGY